MFKFKSPILVLFLISFVSIANAQSIEPAPPLEGSRGLPIEIENGAVIEDALDESCAQEEEKYYKYYSFSLKEDQTCSVRLESNEFDTFLKIEGPEDTYFENDDIGLFNRDSELDFIAEITGNYYIIVTTFKKETTGTYTLTLSAPELPSEPEIIRIEEPGIFEGELTETDIINENKFVDYYDLVVSADLRYIITMESDEIDCYLKLEAEEFSVENDDFEATNSRIELLPRYAVYRISCTSYAHEVGPYTLTIEARTNEILPSDITYYGIFCGCNDYGGWGNLRYCREDAEELAQAYLNQDLMAENQMILLLDRECSPTSIRNAFETMSEQVDSNDIFIFFYSGHGSRSSENSRYEDEIDRRQETLHTPGGPVSDDEMNDLFGTLNDDALKLIVLDACFAGGFSRDVISAPNRVGFFSSEEDMTSLVASRFRAGGYLSLFFRRAVNGAADLDSNGIITIGELKDFLILQYAEDCRQFSSSQQGDRSMQQLVFDRGAVRPSTRFIGTNGD